MELLNPRRQLLKFTITAACCLHGCSSGNPDAPARENGAPAPVINPQRPIEVDGGAHDGADASPTRDVTIDAHSSDRTERSDESTASGPQIGANLDVPSRPSGQTPTPVASSDGASGSDSTKASDSTSSEPRTCDTCPASDDSCWINICNVESGECERLPNTDAVCDDGDTCTENDRCDANGSCAGRPLECPASTNECLVNICNPDSGVCEPEVLPSTSRCDDADPCTLDDQCDGEGGCGGDDRDCSEADGVCAVGVCDATTGACQAVPVDVGETCDDGDRCTTGDQCNGDGTCHGTTVDCSQFDQTCVTGLCSPDTGECEAHPLSGTGCDDGNVCTQNDTCDDGTCVGEIPDTCDRSVTLSVSERETTLLLATECNDNPLENDFDIRRFSRGGGGTARGDCTDSSAADVFIQLDLTHYSDDVRLFATTDNRETNFDTVLALVGATGDAAALCNYDELIACNDALGAETERSTIDIVLAPGMYMLIVDGYIAKDRGLAALSVSVQSP